jgi:hypothetical protein
MPYPVHRGSIIWDRLNKVVIILSLISRASRRSVKLREGRLYKRFSIGRCSAFKDRIKCKCYNSRRRTRCRAATNIPSESQKEESGEEPSVPLRVFLSYSLDTYQESTKRTSETKTQYCRKTAYRIVLIIKPLTASRSSPVRGALHNI